YPALMTGARKHPDTVITAKLFAENILRITESALAFFRKHAAGSIEMDALTRDWRTFVGIIAGRCESEEAVLYPLYENMARVGPAVALRVAV
ncbi:MAG: hypothetical protein ACJ790_04040, partial [Myxococcaceae bacterium]